MARTKRWFTELHVEEEGAHVAGPFTFHAEPEVLDLIAGQRKHSPARRLKALPSGASATVRAALAHLAVTKGVSVAPASAFAEVRWDEGQPREGMLDAVQYAHLLADECVETWSKMVLGEIVENDEMKRRLAAGTATAGTYTRARWTMKLKHVAAPLYRVFLEQLAGRPKRRLIALWGTPNPEYLRQRVRERPEDFSPGIVKIFA